MTLLVALINKVGLPELLRWLAELHAAGVTVITEEMALTKLDMDADEGDAEGLAFLAQTDPGIPPVGI